MIPLFSRENDLFLSLPAQKINNAGLKGRTLFAPNVKIQPIK